MIPIDKQDRLLDEISLGTISNAERLSYDQVVAILQALACRNPHFGRALNELNRKQQPI